MGCPVNYGDDYEKNCDKYWDRDFHNWNNKPVSDWDRDELYAWYDKNVEDWDSTTENWDDDSLKNWDRPSGI
jgi:hypothetical protein